MRRRSIKNVRWVVSNSLKISVSEDCLNPSNKLNLKKVFTLPNKMDLQLATLLSSLIARRWVGLQTL